MTRFHQKFDFVPKLSLRMQLGGLNVNKKYRVLTSALQQRELYLTHKCRTYDNGIRVSIYIQVCHFKFR
jgi:hypothetical protein